MQTGEKVMLIFSKSTCRTERTGSRVTAMYKFSNRKESVDPFTEEGEAKRISKEKGLKDGPINELSIVPWSRKYDRAVKSMGVCEGMDGMRDRFGNARVIDKELTCSCRIQWSTRD